MKLLKYVDETIEKEDITEVKLINIKENSAQVQVTFRDLKKKHEITKDIKQER